MTEFQDSTSLRDALGLARRLAPRILFDLREPFFPRWVGVSLLEAAGPSPSFRRVLTPPSGGCVIEYAIYWDWDIQHLYDLEHIWLYLDSSGGVVDAEASFHGKYLKSLVPGTAIPLSGRLELYSQPGKHAFAPYPGLFRFLPDCASSTGDEAGKAGAEVSWVLQYRITHDPAWDLPVRRYLEGFRFEPAWEFAAWDMPSSIVIAWEELNGLLPSLFEEGLSLAGARPRSL
jgi:hypothetical protein